MTIRLLIDAPNGEQEIIEVGEGGGYFDLARVLWDERIDGPLPVGITLGGMVRQGDALVFSQARMDATNAVMLPPTIIARCAAVDAERDRLMALYLHDFGAPHGVLGLQLRDADDKANWLTLKDSARDLIAAGQGAALLPLRTAENIVLQLSAEQIVAVLGSMAAHGAPVLAASWVHKDAIRALATVEQVAAYDITTGWPT